jgi:hypothetical protein
VTRVTGAKGSRAIPAGHREGVSPTPSLFDSLGLSYPATRREDPRLAAVDAGVDRLRRDLESGAWDRRHGSLRSLPEIDTGHRIVVSDTDAG